MLGPQILFFSLLETLGRPCFLFPRENFVRIASFQDLSNTTQFISYQYLSLTEICRGNWKTPIGDRLKRKSRFQVQQGL